MNFRYTNDNTKGHYTVSKVIVNSGRYAYTLNDYKGEYAMTQNLFAIPISSKKEGDDIVEAFDSEEFKEIIKACKWGIYGLDYRMFKYFRPDFYKQFLGKTSASAKIDALDRDDSGAGVSQQRTKLGCSDCRGNKQCARCKAEELEAKKVERSASSDSKTKKNKSSPKAKKGGSRRTRRRTNKKQQTTRKNKFIRWF